VLIGKEQVQKGTYANANAAVAFLHIFVAFGKGPFGFKCHCYVTAMAATCVGLAVFDVRRGLGAGERSRFVTRSQGFTVEAAWLG
jgi:hypothetical protein